MQKHAHALRQSVVLDLNVDSRIHAAYGTVVVSRVRSRHDVLIMRSFPAWLFQRGAAEGPELLLRKLRGEHIDWDAFPRGALAQGPVPTVPGAQEFGPLRARAVGKDPGQPRSHLPGLPANEQGRQGAAEAELQRPDRRAEEHRVQQLQDDQNRGGLPASPAGAEGRGQEAPVLGLPSRPERAYLHRLPDPKACGGVFSQHVHDAGQRPGLPGLPARNPRQSQTPPRGMVLLQGMPAELPRRSHRQRPPGISASTAPCAQPGKWAGRPALIASARSASRARKKDCARTAHT